MALRPSYLVIDCPDPSSLAEFYASILGLEVTSREDDWVSIGGDGVTRMGFQRSDDYQAPTWPDPTMPQQMHIDIEVDDLAAADREVQDLGATKLASDGKDFWVYADPAGHPFCLIF